MHTYTHITYICIYTYTYICIYTYTCYILLWAKRSRPTEVGGLSARWRRKTRQLEL